MNLKLGSLMAVALLAAPILNAEQTVDPRYYSIESMQIEEIELSDVEATELFNAQVRPSLPTPVPNPLPPTTPPTGPAPMPAPFPAPGTGTPGTDYGSGSGPTDALGGVVNLAKSLWDIVVDNRPVVNITVDHANALPVGVTDWTQLSSWQVPKGKAYHVAYINGFGSNVVDFTFRVLFVPGGKINGRGAFITNATIVPANVQVSWGFKFAADAKVSSVTNAGTLKNPLAAMQLDMHWTVDSVLKHHQQTENFYIRGDGTLMNLSDDRSSEQIP